MLRVRNVEGFNSVPYLPTSPKYSLSYSQSAVLLVSFSIVFAVSPSATHPKMVELCNHKAHASFHHACAEDGNLKHPHPPIIDEDNWGIGGWLLVEFGVGGHLTRNVPR